MFYGFNRDQRTPRERDLEAELDDYRRRDEERQLERERELKAQQQERRARYEEQLRSASDWKESLAKQARLFEREQNVFDDGDTFFGDGAKACRRALEIWKAFEGQRSDEIAALEQQLEAIQDGIKLAVAAQLESESAATGWRNVAQSLRTEDPEDWLNW